VSRSTGRARATNAARRKRQRAIQVVATHPAGELSKTIKQDVDQNVNTSSKRSTAESRFMFCGLNNERGTVYTYAIVLSVRALI